MEYLSGYSQYVSEYNCLQIYETTLSSIYKCGKSKKKIMLLTLMIEKITEIKACLLPGNPCWL